MTGFAPRIDLGHVTDASTLFSGLGPFWSRLHENPDFVKRIQIAAALNSAQAQLGLNAIAASIDRSEIPVKKRVRWLPADIRLSERDTGAAALLRFGMEPAVVFGEQTNPLYGDGVMFEWGGCAGFRGVHTYPLHVVGGSAESLTCITITDAITNTAICLAAGIDFIIVDGTLVVKAYADPFDSGSFHRCVVGDDIELSLWLCDAELDGAWVPNLAKLFGLRVESTEQARVCLNAAIDAYTSGSSYVSVFKLLCSMFGVPFADPGTVERIVQDNGDTVVVTDNDTYRLRAGMELADGLVNGSVIDAPSPLSSAVMFYPAGTPNSEIRATIPEITFPPSCFSADLAGSLSMSWAESPVVCEGTDLNGNPKLSFAVSGGEEDVSKFWAAVWSDVEQAGVSMADILKEWLDPAVETFDEGSVCGLISPLAFMLNLAGGSIATASVDLSKLPDSTPMSGIADVAGVPALITQLMPAYARLFALVKDTAQSPPYLLDTESGYVYDGGVSLGVWASATSTGNLVRNPPGPAMAKTGLSCVDTGVRTRWIPACTL